jgi:hypothetical protein
MKKVISFSIYGDKPMFTIGILRNLELAKTVYPDWKVYVYYNNTVPKDMIEKYSQFDNCELFDMTDFQCPGVLWRFLPKENVERFISRDADSRISMREKHAVDEWIESGKSLHIMRDHPYHIQLYAGLFGLVVTEDLDLKKDILTFISNISPEDANLYNKSIDTPFLDQYVYNRYIGNGDIICHDSCHTQFPYSKPFPTKMEDQRFIGEVYDENDKRSPFWAGYLLWKKTKELGY